MSDLAAKGDFLRNDKDALAEGAKPRPKRKRKVSYLTINKIDTVDYKDVSLLRRFMNDRYKIVPARQSGNTAKQQRMVAEAIRRARDMALLPFVANEVPADTRGSMRRERRVEAAPVVEAPAAPAAE
jgi:small subunit ribosomal protein S18